MIPYLLTLGTIGQALVLVLFAGPAAQVGDYVLQTQRMQAKTSGWPWALIHAVVYLLPFAMLTLDPLALGLIAASHAVIDRYRLGARWCAWWGVGRRGRVDEALGLPCDGEAPTWMQIWLSIRADNAMHAVLERGFLFLAWWRATGGLL